jgi:hypothetical protein
MGSFKKEEAIDILYGVASGDKCSSQLKVFRCYLLEGLNDERLRSLEALECGCH